MSAPAPSVRVHRPGFRASGRRTRFAAALAALAALALVWSKWRFSPFKLPVVVLVPWVMVRSWLWGWVRARRVLERTSSAAAAR